MRIKRIAVFMIGAVIGISSFCFRNQTVSAASKSKEPDNVEIVDVDPAEVTDPECTSEEDLKGYMEVWDLTKQVRATYGNLCYYAFLSQDGESCWITEVGQLKAESLSELDIPDTIQNAAVRKLGSSYNNSGSDIMQNIWGTGMEPYHGWDGYDNIPAGIKSVKIPSTVNEIVFGTFCGFRELTSITIPDGVTTLGYATFYNCISLKKIVFPASLESFHFMAFKKCKSLDTISISKDSKNFICKDGMLLSKDGKTVVWVQPKISKLVIPEGVTKIDESATIYSNVTSISIPKSVTSIKNMALNGNKIKTITISSKNPRYAMSGNCIYSKKTKRLVAVVSKDGKLTLPKEVLYLKNNVSVAGKSITELTIPATFKGFQESWSKNPKLSGIDNVYFKSKTPPSAEKDAFAFFTTYVVPKGSLKKYVDWYCKAQEIENLEDGYTSFIEK